MKRNFEKFSELKIKLSCDSSLFRFQSLDVLKIACNISYISRILIAYELVLHVAELFSDTRDNEHAGGKKNTSRERHAAFRKSLVTVS
jgi:hypothetical protein